MFCLASKAWMTRLSVEKLSSVHVDYDKFMIEIKDSAR